MFIIEKIKVKTTLKMGRRVFNKGAIYSAPNIDPELLREVKFKTGTIEVLSQKKVVKPRIVKPPPEEKEVTGVSSAGETSNIFEGEVSSIEETKVVPVEKQPEEVEEVIDKEPPLEKDSEEEEKEEPSKPKPKKKVRTRRTRAKKSVTKTKTERSERSERPKLKLRK